MRLLSMASVKCKSIGITSSSSDSLGQDFHSTNEKSIVDAV